MRSTDEPRPSLAVAAGGPAAVRPWLVFSAIAAGIFMATLDGNIVNVALPTLGAELGAPVHRLQLIVNAYLAAISLTLILLGRLGDRFGHRAVYVAGLSVFTLGSALCGLAPSLGALVAARVLQAFGASAMMAIAPGAITAAFSPAQRGRALGAVGTVVALGLTVGPPLGGLIVATLSWRWVFFVNLPVGIAAVSWGLRALPRGGGARGGPLVDPGLFRIADFSWGLAAGLLSYAAMFSQTFLTPFLLDRVLGLDAGPLGFVLVSVPVALSVASPLAGWLLDRFGLRFLPVAGMLVLAAGLLALSAVERDTSVASVVARLAACGIGMGLFQSPNNTVVMSSLPRERLGSGGGLLATARNVGMALGVGIAGALFSTRAGAGREAGEFLAGYALALEAGAALALAAAAASLATRGRGHSISRATPPGAGRTAARTPPAGRRSRARTRSRSPALRPSR